MLSVERALTFFRGTVGKGDGDPLLPELFRSFSTIVYNATFMCGLVEANRSFAITYALVIISLYRACLGDDRISLPDVLQAMCFKPPFTSVYCTTKHKNSTGDTFFINGINCTPKRSEFLAKRIGETFGMKVSLLHNHTHGFVSDVADAGLQLLLNYTSPNRRDIKQDLVASLGYHKTITVFAHSEGVISIVNILKDRDAFESRYKDIMVVSFGMCPVTATHTGTSSGPYIKYVINRADLIVRGMKKILPQNPRNCQIVYLDGGAVFNHDLNTSYLCLMDKPTINNIMYRM